MIRLLLDGFELLDDLPYDEVLRDGDLVCIQISEEASVTSEELGKRKRQHIDDDYQKRQSNAQKRTRPSQSRSSNKSSSTDTSTDSDGESDTSSVSTSSSSEPSGGSKSSEASSGYSPAPKRPSNQRPSQQRIKAPTVVPAASHVPPGYGRPSTKSRNLRRRLKRQYEREAKEAEKSPPRLTSEANTTPLGAKPFKASTTVTTEEPNIVGAAPAGPARNQPSPTENLDTPPPSNLNPSRTDIMMGSLRNKNKKRNFRQTMFAPLVRKIVFGDDGNVQPTASPSSPEQTQTNGTPLRVGPPSDLFAAGLLPRNMFVTSVEFGRHYKKKRRMYQEGVDEGNVKHESKTYEETHEDADIWLPYWDEEGGSGEPPAVQDSHPQFDWKFAETNWERLPLIQSLDQLHSGVLICWQGLAINPKTFTPEYLLGAGRVEKLESTMVTIRQILRPGTETATAFGIGSEVGGEGEPEDYSWDEIAGLGWKIIKPNEMVT